MADHAEILREHVRKAVAQAPALSDEQRMRIACLLSGRRAPLPRMDQTPPPVRKCALYRHFDDQGTLLYVGISVEPTTRGRAHARHSAFMEFAVRQETEWLDSEEAAHAAEREAIANERPLFNKTGADPDRDRRLLDYLIARNAYHLLRLP